MLKKVVLPAPFGPMTANRLPSGISRLMSLLAVNPANRLVRLRTASNAMAQLPALFSAGHGRPMPDSADNPFGT